MRPDTEDKITSVTWTSEGDGLSSTEFGQFNMSGKVADKAKEIVWKAYQTYSDGSVVEWVGAQDAQHPASVTLVNPKPADGKSDNHGTTMTSEPKEEVKTTTSTSDPSNTPLYISIAALVAGLLSLGISLK